MRQLFEKLIKDFDTVSPAIISTIETAEKFFNLKFPTDYKEFLQLTNGLELETSDNYLVLWSAEELVELNQAYNVKEFVSLSLLVLTVQKMLLLLKQII